MISFHFSLDFQDYFDNNMARIRSLFVIPMSYILDTLRV